MRVSDAIERLVAARSRDDLIDAVIAGAGSVVAADGVRIAELRMAPSISYKVSAQRIPAPDPSPSIVRAPLSHPIVAEYVRSRFQGWISIQDLLPRRAWLRHPLYLEVYRPLGLAAHISCALRDTGTVMYSLSLNRSGRDFSYQEREELRRYRGLVQTAWLRIEDFEVVTHVLESLYRSHSDDSLLVLSLDPVNARIVYASPRMKVLLKDRDELRQAAEEVALATTATDSGVARSSILDSHLVAVRTADAVIVRVQPATTPALTRREVQIMAALSAGETAHAIAGYLGISEGTVRKHLENIYAKLNVHDRLRAVNTTRSLGLID